MARVKIIDKDLGWTSVKQNLRLLNNSFVKIGIVQSSLGRQRPSKGRPVHSAKELSTFPKDHEFGNRLEKIPERSWLRSTFDEKKSEMNSFIEKEWTNFVGISPKSSLDKVGKKFSRFVKNKIRDIKFPPNTPDTIAIKGFDDPLIDTKNFMRAIDHEVVLRRG